MPEKQTAGSTTLPPISLWRRAKNNFVTFAAVAAVVLVLLPLGAIFAYLVYKGIGSINWAFLTQTPKPVGEPGGGMANAIAGSALILAIASVMGVPLGIGAGIYLAEYGQNRLGTLIRFTADVLNGVPSIVIGIVAYGLVVLTQKHFSALAGGVALAIMMIPTIPVPPRKCFCWCRIRSAKPPTGWGLALADYAFDHPAHRDLRGHHRCYAGLCPDCGRDGAAAVHRLRQPVLELEAQSAHCGAVAADFQLRHFAVR